MFARALSSVGLAIVVCCYAAASWAQNLEAGKSPQQIFNGACAVCHKSPRGLLQSVPPGSLPGFLRQHYTTSSDMAAVLSGYLLSNGAVDKRRGEPPRRGREARPVAAPEPAPAPAPRSFWPWNNGPSAQSVGAGAAVGEADREAKQRQDRKSSAKHRKKKTKSDKKMQQEQAPEQPSGAAGNEAVKPEAAKPDASKSGAPKSEVGGGASVDRTDPVPAVTPAPSAPASSPTPSASEPKTSQPSSSESKPAETKSD